MPRTVTPANAFAGHGHRLAFDVGRRRLDVVAREHALARVAPIRERLLGSP